jgi:hypothetical protein
VGPAVSGFLQGLREPEYVHVLLNHLPLVGLFAALLCLLTGLVSRSRTALFLGLGLVSLFALAAWPVAEYGEQGYDRVLSMADDEGQAYLSRHRELADKWIWLYYVTAGAGALAMVAGWKWPKTLWAASLGIALSCSASLVAGGFIADCGGRVRHREFRHGPPPKSETPSTQRSAAEPRTNPKQIRIPNGEKPETGRDHL